MLRYMFVVSAAMHKTNKYHLKLNFNSYANCPECERRWSWYDSNDLSYKRWASGYPKSMHRCVILDEDGWEDYNCYLDRPFICKRIS